MNYEFSIKHIDILLDLVFKEIENNKNTSSSMMKNKKANIQEYEETIDKLKDLRYISESLQRR